MYAELVASYEATGQVNWLKKFMLGLKVVDEIHSVASGFKNKTRYTPYVSPGSQISHIAINKGNIKRQCSIYNVLSIWDITLDSK